MKLIKEHSDWQSARNHAEAYANRYCMAMGVEHIGNRWIVRMIPTNPAHRFGCDARCEAVEPAQTREERDRSWGLDQIGYEPDWV